MLSRSLVIVVVVAVVAAEACSRAPEAGSTRGSDAGATGTIVGTIQLRGAVPAAGVIRLDADPQCVRAAGGAEAASEDVVVGPDGGLANVFVRVARAAIAGGAIPKEPVVLDQQKCRFTPRVLGVQTGQMLTMRNSDPVLHTIRADAVANQRFAIATPIQGMEIPRSFSAPEVMVPVKCDMHPWMQAYIAVVDHPFFDVSDERGAFAITGVPAGRYVLETWHERFGTQTQSLSVTAGAQSAADFVYDAR